MNVSGNECDASNEGAAGSRKPFYATGAMAVPDRMRSERVRG
jgi:hypothetical protein